MRVGSAIGKVQHLPNDRCPACKEQLRRQLPSVRCVPPRYRPSRKIVVVLGPLCFACLLQGWPRGGAFPVPGRMCYY
ncbi:MAG: hypothetical protein M0031_13650 [Thermaerobacter sp.]|nr:hypothetical protein [Thermaerobacter sp.]